MNNSKIWKEMITIPTYGIGKENKNPMFFEKRTYQASSGKVYPYPIIDTLTNKKQDKEYIGIYLENDYIKVLILPEIGGKIHQAIDKTNNYDFVYHNEVIKPALVGLLGPWVSGGIEFNWPQHHRPTTFMKCEYEIKENEDGSVSAILYDFDRMNGTNVVTSFTLYKDKSYIKINARLFNPTCENQTFLWWANPAVAVNDNTQSIFPPDVTAVYDHGKRAVSKFPIATGEYYKHDYKMGVDISRYKNIPVPTSYMAYKSKYDFVGNYDYGKNAGLLHVADHHISPGKKQWTWGNGDFGQAWDRNLTDKNGPYIELMTGVFTDNQPDFSWLKPYEEKEFNQYFMPYKEIGAVKNANTDYVLNLEVEENTASFKIYSTGENECIVSLIGDKVYFNEKVLLSPNDILSKSIKAISCSKEDLKLTISNLDGKELICYQEEETELTPLPKPQKPAEAPKDIRTTEELYLTGQHIEQYRHATFIADDYYLEGLKRDENDIRCNIAYGSLLLRRGQFEKAEKHFKTAIKRLTKLHPNPYDSEAYVYLGYALKYQEKYDEAYEYFFKGTWMQSEAAVGFYEIAILETRKKEYLKALEFVNKALQYNTKNYLARGLKVLLLMKLNEEEKAKKVAKENLEDNSFDFISYYLLSLMDSSVIFDFTRINTFLSISSFLVDTKNETLALELLNKCKCENIMIEYYKAYCLIKANLDATAQLEKANKTAINSFFANGIQDEIVLNTVIKADPNNDKALYLLGNMHYNNMRFAEAKTVWTKCAEINDNFSSVHRNLSIILFNKYNEVEKAKAEIEKAFKLDSTDSRLFFELDQMYKKVGKSINFRLDLYEKFINLVIERSDLKCEYATLLNLSRKHKEAYDFIMSNIFNPWEGGEGKVSTQYTLALRELAIKEIDNKNYQNALDLLYQALVYPHNLGEGILEGNKSNDIYYYLGIAYQGLNNDNKANECFEKATLGNSEPAGILYYYDQPADMIYYKGLAFRALNNEPEARSCFNKLIDYGEQHYFDHIKLDYFAVSLPDLQLFDEDLDKKNKIHCNFLLALGNLGMNNEKYKKYLNQALEEDNSHFRAKLILKD